jgi:hypothetical protein
MEGTAFRRELPASCESLRSKRPIAGPATATGVTVTDVLPPGTSFLSSTPSAGTCTGTTTVVCAIPTLAPGASATIRFVFLADDPMRVLNTVTITANEPDPNPANNAATTPANIPTMSEWMLIGLGR